MKRIIFCFDGTWNQLGTDTPTNVVLTAASIVRDAAGTIQIIHYDDGVGTLPFQKHIGGIFGAGLVQNVREAYRFLIFNYDPGDEIFVFGFSRGAFAARTFVNFIRHLGPLSRLHAAYIDKALKLYRKRGAAGAEQRMRRFRSERSADVCISLEDEEWRCKHVRGYVPNSAPVMTIRYLGVWDTVGAVGIPVIGRFGRRLLNRRHAFHDMALTPFVENARHAVGHRRTSRFVSP